MVQTEAKRRIGALTAIVKMLMPDRYGAPRQDDAVNSILELAEDGDPLASAITNELTKDEIEQALASPKGPHATHEEALRAIPVYSCLTPEQRERARDARGRGRS